MIPTESLTNEEWLLGELLSGSECRRPGWLLDMKYQTCLLSCEIIVGGQPAMVARHICLCAWTTQEQQRSAEGPQRNTSVADSSLPYINSA